jgi:signal transduction histidine kinase
VTAHAHAVSVPEASKAPRANPAFLVALGAAAVAMTAIMITAPSWVSYTTIHVPTLAAATLTGASFNFLGLYAYAKRPDNRVGPLMLAVGFAFGAQLIGWIETDATYTIGTFLLQDLWIVVLGHLFLAFPTGRLGSRLDRGLVLTAYAWWIVSGMLRLAFLDFLANGWAFDNIFLIHSDNDLAESIGRVESMITASLTIAFLYALMRHWRRATQAGRRVLAPVVWASVPTAAAIVIRMFADTMQIEPLYEAADGPLGLLALTALPVGFALGLFRSRLGRSQVGDLVVELGESREPGRARDTLARILQDPSLRIAYRLPGSSVYVDGSGAPMAIDDMGGFAVTPIERAGEPIAALVHDPADLQDPDLLRSAVAATRLAVENERLEAEVRAQLEEVRTSRARIVEAGDAERRRVERNLHDGAQQRLVMLSMGLRRLRAELPNDASPALANSVEDLLAESKLAIDEVRELARGIHPAILTEEGVGAAVESLADRSPVPVRIEEVPDRRYADPIEATAYYVVAESLANTAKYASASLATVAIRDVDGALAIEVTDDGVGGADLHAGTGLRGLLDRVSAVGGRLTVESPVRGGTLVRAEIPLDGR